MYLKLCFDFFVYTENNLVVDRNARTSLIRAKTIHVDKECFLDPRPTLLILSKLMLNRVFKISTFFKSLSSSNGCNLIKMIFHVEKNDFLNTFIKFIVLCLLYIRCKLWCHLTSQMSNNNKFNRISI